MPPGSEDGEPEHVVERVYGEMLVQVCRDYQSLSNPLRMRLPRLHFFYEALRAELKERTAPPKKNR